MKLYHGWGDKFPGGFINIDIDEKDHMDYSKKAFNFDTFQRTLKYSDLINYKIKYVKNYFKKSIRTKLY